MFYGSFSSRREQQLEIYLGKKDGWALTDAMEMAVAARVEEMRAVGQAARELREDNDKLTAELRKRVRRLPAEQQTLVKFVQAVGRNPELNDHVIGKRMGLSSRQVSRMRRKLKEMKIKTRGRGVRWTKRGKSLTESRMETLGVFGANVNAGFSDSAV